MSADGGANFSPPVEVPSDAAQTFMVDNLTGGDYLFRAVVVDTANRRSTDSDIVGQVEVAPPSAIADLSVTIE